MLHFGTENVTCKVETEDGETVAEFEVMDVTVTSELRSPHSVGEMSPYSVDRKREITVTGMERKKVDLHENTRGFITGEDIDADELADELEATDDSEVTAVEDTCHGGGYGQISDASDDAADDESDVFVCTECGHEADLDTPQHRTDAFCQGECDGFSMFERDRGEE